MRRLPIFDVTGVYLLRAIVVGSALGIAGGALVGFTTIIFPFPLLHVIAIVVMGYLIAEGISISVNRKLGLKLRLIASGSTLGALLIVLSLGMSVFAIIGGLAALYVAWSRF